MIISNTYIRHSLYNVRMGCCTSLVVVALSFQMDSCKHIYIYIYIYSILRYTYIPVCYVRKCVKGTVYHFTGMSSSMIAQTLILMASISAVKTHRILILPHSGEYISHLLREVRLGDLLIEARHQVTYLINDKHPGRSHLGKNSLVLYELPDVVRVRVDTMENFSTSSPLQAIFTIPFDWQVLLMDTCSLLLESETLLEKLKNKRYDFIIVDAGDECGRILTHWGRDQMNAISQTMFSNAFSWMKLFDYRLKFHWSLFLKVQLTISQHWFR